MRACTSWCRAARPGKARRSRREERRRVVEAGRRSGRRARAGARRRRRLRHARGDRGGARRWPTRAPQGILSVTPYYNKPTQEGLYQHYRAIAEQHAAADRRLQRAGPHRLQRRARHARPPRRRSQHRRRQGSVGEHGADLRGLPRVPADFLVLSGDDAIDAAGDGGGRRGVISVAATKCPAKWPAWSKPCERSDWAAARDAAHALISRSWRSTSSNRIRFR